eukprot:gene21241-biopygen1096
MPAPRPLHPKPKKMLAARAAPASCFPWGHRTLARAWRGHGLFPLESRQGSVMPGRLPAGRPRLLLASYYMVFHVPFFPHHINASVDVVLFFL